MLDTLIRIGIPDGGGGLSISNESPGERRFEIIAEGGDKSIVLVTRTLLVPSVTLANIIQSLASDLQFEAVSSSDQEVHGPCKEPFEAQKKVIEAGPTGKVIGS